MNASEPTFSVVIPLFNKGRFIREAVQSALSQDGSLVEVIVVDDGSTDGGATGLAAMDERVVVLKQKNAGVSVARNRGLRVARGDFVAFLDADDRYLPGHLVRLATLRRQYPLAQVLCCGYRCFWPDGRAEVHALPQAQGVGAVDDFYAAWLRRSFTCASAIAVSGTALQKMAEPFPEGEGLGEDQDLWFRLAEQWPVACVSQIGAEYRMEVSESATARDARHELLPCYLRLADRIECGVTPAHLRCSGRRLVAAHYQNVALQCLRHGMADHARQLLFNRRSMALPIAWLRVVAKATMAGQRRVN